MNSVQSWKEFFNDSLGPSQLYYYLDKFKEIISLFTYLLSFETATAIFSVQNYCVYNYLKGLGHEFPNEQEVLS